MKFQETVENPPLVARMNEIAAGKGKKAVEVSGLSEATIVPVLDDLTVPLSFESFDQVVTDDDPIMSSVNYGSKVIDKANMAVNESLTLFASMDVEKALSGEWINLTEIRMGAV